MLFFCFGLFETLWCEIPHRVIFYIHIPVCVYVFNLRKLPLFVLVVSLLPDRICASALPAPKRCIDLGIVHANKCGDHRSACSIPPPPGGGFSVGVSSPRQLVVRETTPACGAKPNIWDISLFQRCTGARSVSRTESSSASCGSSLSCSSRPTQVSQVKHRSVR